MSSTLVLENEKEQPSPSNFMGMLAYTRPIDAKEFKNKTQSVWGAIGVLAALVATIAASNLNSAPVELDDYEAVKAAYFVLNYVSLLFNIASIILIALAYTGTEFCIGDDIFLYMEKMYFLGDQPMILFAIGAICIVASFLLPLQYQTNTTLFWIMFILAVIVTAYLSIVMKMSMSIYWSLWRNNPQTVKNDWNGRKIKGLKVHPESATYAPPKEDVQIVHSLQ